MRQLKICMLGGTGFVGRSLAERLVLAGHHVRIITRHRDRHRDLLVLPTLQLIEGSVSNQALLEREFQGMDAVINLVGILNERGRRGEGFERVHVDLPRRVVAACRAAHVKRLLHMSALGAGVDAPSYYQRTKARGEALVHEAKDLQVTTFRPSVIFGPHDSFINRFAHLLRRTPLVFPLAMPESKLQPVYVEDVTAAYENALDNHKTFGQSYELCGPRVYTLQEIVTYIAEVIEVRRKIVGLSAGLSRLQAGVLQFVPGKPFTPDNYRSLTVDNVCSRGFPEVFAITPRPLEAVVPTYLQPRREEVT